MALGAVNQLGENVQLIQGVAEVKEETYSGYLTSRIKSLFGGAMMATLTCAKDEAISKLAERFQLIPSEPCFFWRSQYLSAIRSCKCFIPPMEFWKVMSYRSIVYGGIQEELIFRGLIQDLLLKQVLREVITVVSPKNGDWVDTKSAKIFRITLTSALFSAYHLSVDPTSLVAQYQSFVTLSGGAILGAIKESDLGLVGSVGCHMMHNTVAAIYSYVLCVPK